MKDERNPGAIQYFDKRTGDFDRIYDENRSGLRAWLDKTLRASVTRRFRLAFDIISDLNGKSVLDIGCGSGRYMFEAVRRGATTVVGIDAAAGALDAARKTAQRLGLESQVRFCQADFIDFGIESQYDIVFAIGYFDYIFDPAPHLKKMLAACDSFLIASFPRLWHPLTPVRKVRLALDRCPVRFYSRSRVERLLHDDGCTNYEIKSVARDFVVVVRG